MTMREHFDFLLASAARDAGAVLRDACAVRDVTLRADGVELSTTQGTVLAQFVIGADGATSVIARKGGWPRAVRVMPALECEVFVDNEDFRRFDGCARFDFDVVQSGYAWVFPKRDHLSIGVGVVRSSCGGLRLREAFARYVTQLGLRRIERMDQHGFLVPLGPRSRALVKERIVLVGDAAGLADPVTGEGITFAVQSGELAARSLVDGNLDKDLVRRLFGEGLEQAILPELRVGRLLSKVLYGNEHVRRWLFRRHGQILAETMTDVMMGKKSLQGIFRSPASYLKVLRLVSAN